MKYATIHLDTGATYVGRFVSTRQIEAFARAYPEHAVKPIPASEVSQHTTGQRTVQFDAECRVKVWQSLPRPLRKQRIGNARPPARKIFVMVPPPKNPRRMWALHNAGVDERLLAHYQLALATRTD